MSLEDKHGQERLGHLGGRLSSPALDDTRDLIIHLDKAVRVIKMYLPNNPQHQLFLGKAVAKFKEYLELHPMLRLQVSRFELISDEEAVYQNEDRTTSLAFVLYRDGVRQLSFLPGIEEEEIREFIQAFNRDFTGESLDEDLVTYFWERNFRHIQYVATEDFMEEFLPAAVLTSPDRDQALRQAGNPAPVSASDLSQAVAPGAGNVAAAPLCHSTLMSESLVMTEEEIERLRRLVDEDAGKQYSSLLIEVLISIIKEEEDQASIADLLGLLRRIVELNLSRGDFQGAGSLISRLMRLAGEADSISPELGAKVRGVVGYFGGEEFVRSATPAIVKFAEKQPDDVPGFVGLLPPPAAAGLLNLFEHIGSMKGRKALCRGLATLVEQDLATVSKGVVDGRWYVVRNTVFVLGMVKTAGRAPLLRTALKHPDLRVRREAVRVGLSVEDADIDDFVLAALDDPDEKQRLYVIRNLPHRVGGRVKAKLSTLIAAPEFAKRPDDERRGIYGALARVGEGRELSIFEPILARKSWLRKDVQREQQWVVEALAAGSESSRRFLRETAGAGSGNLKEMIDRAMNARGGASKEDGQ